MWHKPFIAIFLVLALLRPCVAQQRVQEQVSRIAIGGPLTVKMTDGRELHGNLSAIEATSFSLREVDLNRTLTIQYSEANRVSAGYGRKGFMGRRVSPQRHILVAMLVAAGLVALLVAAAASDKS